MNHDILLPGQVYLMFIKEKLQEYLATIAFQINKDVKRAAKVEFFSCKFPISLWKNCSCSI